MTKTRASLALLASTFLATPALWAAGAADHIQITAPSVRAVPAGQDQTAAYATLRNSDKQGHAVTGAASPAARVVELHTVLHEGGMMKMRPVTKMEIPAGGEAKLASDGLHIMLIGIKQPLTAGAHVVITLTFEDGSRKDMHAVVQSMAMPAGMPHGH